jgi:hypothetical protein
LAKEYGVGCAMIYDIRKNREIECFVKNTDDMCYKWAEGNSVRAEDILTFKRLQEKILKKAFRNKKQKTIDAFFKNPVK